MRADAVNKEFETMLNALKPKDNVKELFAEIFNDVSGEGQRDINATKMDIQKEIDVIQQKMNKAQDMLLDEKISSDDFSAMSERLKKQMERKQEQLEDLQALPSEGEISAKMVAVSGLLYHLGDFLRQLPVDERIDICGSILSEKLRFSKEKTRTVKFKDSVLLMCENSMPCESENKTAPSDLADSAAWCPKPGSNRHVF